MAFLVRLRHFLFTQAPVRIQTSKVLWMLSTLYNTNDHEVIILILAPISFILQVYYSFFHLREFRQRGHEPWILSHTSIHSTWKQWSHSGMNRIVSLLAYSDKQIGHIIPLVPGSLLLSPNSTFLYVSIVDWSRPLAAAIISLGCCRTVAAAAIAECPRLGEL